MSIKCYGKELYVGKTESNIIDSRGNRQKIEYSLLSSINYCLPGESQKGYIIFNFRNGNMQKFDFSPAARKKLQSTITLIAEHNSDLIIIQNESVIYKKSYVKPVIIGISVLTFLAGAVCIGKLSRSPELAPEETLIESIFSEISMESTDTPTEEIRKGFSATLIAGHYTVGIDIPSGTYSFFSKSGSGNLYTDDGSINAIFDHDNYLGEHLEDYGISDFGTEELRNIALSSGTILTVTGTQQISAGCDDGLISEMTERDQDHLEELEIGYGDYGAIENIPAGTYDIIWLEGNGNIISESKNSNNRINEIMGSPEEININDDYDDILNDTISHLYIQEFKNFTIEEGDILKISDIKVKLIPSK